MHLFYCYHSILATPPLILLPGEKGDAFIISDNYTELIQELIGIEVDTGSVDTGSDTGSGLTMV
jgi:hypothetical protein